MSGTTTYSPAQAAARSGFSTETLRYYERAGILAPVGRTAGGRRAYTDDDLWTLGFLRCLRDTGMPIAALRRYAELSADPATMPARADLLAEHDEAITRRIAELRAQQDRLREKIAWYRAQD
ncbi:MerR family transcriptional regulator [Kineococcus sp. SYSU DK003]|uniref:MerR family transcriptional regulator n=1 Tax=Kineococcus sp. SYSU DK003 TaxID=3383124 RepID=UPI003D7E27B9